MMAHRYLSLSAVVLLIYGCGGSDGDSTPPLPPALVATTPTSPSIDSTPAVRGNTEAGALVRLYTDTNCAGPVFGSDTADAMGVFVVVVTRPVVGDVTTGFRATATDAAGNVSRCSVPLPYRSLIPAVSFATGSSVGVGDGPNSVALNDLDGDGNLDLAVANEASNDVSVLLGNGDGSFTVAAGSPIPVGDQPVHIAIGDLDRDGSPDLVTANRVSENVSVLLGGGDGTFTEPTNSPFDPSDRPSSVAIGDLNEDGRPDLTVALPLISRVSVLLGNGDGSFAAAAGSPFPLGVLPSFVAIGDLDGDTALDLVTANDSSDDVSALLGNGDRTFGTKLDFGAGNGPRSLALGDLDGDGNLDLAVGNFFSDNVSVLLGNGDGTFTGAANFNVGDAPSSVAVGDLNRDGRLDLAVTNDGDDNVSVLLGDRAGAFVATAGSPFVVGTSPASVAIGDLDGDGRPDLAVANRLSDTVSVLLGEP